MLRLALTGHLQDWLADQHLHGHSRDILAPLPVPTQEGGRRYMSQAGLGGVTKGRCTSSFPGGGLGCVQSACSEQWGHGRVAAKAWHSE